tara:strand:+ start:5117 stop:5326 length:210 start_codon:yes stop_codon:yes gene_type:complete
MSGEVDCHAIPEELTCVLCGLPIKTDWAGWKYGHNALPVKVGRACDDCQITVILPARIGMIIDTVGEEE